MSHNRYRTIVANTPDEMAMKLNAVAAETPEDEVPWELVGSPFPFEGFDCSDPMNIDSELKMRIYAFMGRYEMEDMGL